MEKIDIDFILFDMIGTTILDLKEGKSVILESFSRAFVKNSIHVKLDALNEQRGKTKITAIQVILAELNEDANLIETIYKDFMMLLDQSIYNFQSLPEVTSLFKTLKSKGIKIGIGSGLPLEFMNALMQHLKWDKSLFDYINSSDELDLGRPDPIMIQDAMQTLGLPDKSKILKVGDTVVDVLEGKNAGVKTAMVLSGTQNKSNLGSIQPDYIFKDVHSIAQILQ